MWTWAMRGAKGVLVLLVIMQLVPIRVTNPPLEQDASTSPEVMAVL
jgi:hypothetical protein